MECETGEGRTLTTDIKYQELNIKNVLFDLDGTLTDSKEGITNSYLNALNELGLIENNEASIIEYIGQPLHKYFEVKHNLLNKELKLAVNLYREYYSRKGMYENKLYEGIEQLLRKFKENNKQIFLITGKPLKFAKEILRYFEIDSYFLNMYGSGSGVVNYSKEELLSMFIKNEQPDTSKTVMIGDTKYDIHGAKQFGIKSIAVSYGYGSLQELKESNPDYLANSVEELNKLILNI